MPAACNPLTSHSGYNSCPATLFIDRPIGFVQQQRLHMISCWAAPTSCSYYCERLMNTSVLHLCWEFSSWTHLTAATVLWNCWRSLVNTLLPFSNQNIGHQNEPFEYYKVFCWHLTRSIRTFPAVIVSLSNVLIAVFERGPSLAQIWQCLSVLVH